MKKIIFVIGKTFLFISTFAVEGVNEQIEQKVRTQQDSSLKYEKLKEFSVPQSTILSPLSPKQPLQIQKPKTILSKPNRPKVLEIPKKPDYLLINKHWILTLAKWDIQSIRYGNQTLEVDKIIYHPKWAPYAKLNHSYSKQPWWGLQLVHLKEPLENVQYIDRKNLVNFSRNNNAWQSNLSQAIHALIGQSENENYKYKLAQKEDIYTYNHLQELNSWIDKSIQEYNSNQKTETKLNVETYIKKNPDLKEMDAFLIKYAEKEKPLSELIRSLRNIKGVVNVGLLIPKKLTYENQDLKSKLLSNPKAMNQFLKDNIFAKWDTKISSGSAVRTFSGNKLSFAELNRKECIKVVQGVNSQFSAVLDKIKGSDANIIIVKKPIITQKLLEKLGLS